MGPLCHRGVGRVVAVRHSRVINGKCFRSSLQGDRQCFCSARSQLLMLLPEEGSTAQRERLSYSLPHGPMVRGKSHLRSAAGAFIMASPIC